MDVVKTEVPSYSLTDINKAIERVARSQGLVQQAIGAVLVMAVYASIVGIEGDRIGVANALLKVLRKSTKRDAIVAFLEQFGQLYVPQGEKAFVHFAEGVQGQLQWTKEYVAKVKLAATDWESFKSTPAATELDVEAGVQTLITKAAKAQKANKPVKNSKLVAELVAVLAKYHAAQAEGVAQ